MTDLILSCNDSPVTPKWHFVLEHIRKGQVIRRDVVHNLLVSDGKAVLANLSIATGTAPNTIRLGTGTNAAVVGDHALQTETHSGTAARSAVTTLYTGDTAQYEYTFTFAGNYAITEAGLTATAVLICRQVFSAVDVVALDSLKITWKLQY